MLPWDSKRKFLFKCAECSIILSVEFESQEDIDLVLDDKMKIDCPCGEKCSFLRD